MPIKTKEQNELENNYQLSFLASYNANILPLPLAFFRAMLYNIE